MKYYINVFRVNDGSPAELPAVKSEWEAIEQAANEMMLSNDKQYYHTVVFYGIVIKALDLYDQVKPRAEIMARQVDEYLAAYDRPATNVIQFQRP